MKRNAVNAILEIYKNSIKEFKLSINDISNDDLILILDKNTTNEDCRSIQNILSHTINAGYSYIDYIQKNRNVNFKKPEKKYFFSIIEYQNSLDEMFYQTKNVFEDIFDNELEKYNQSDKIQTRWGQCYDIEQIMEHAIVHIFRHQLQINNLLNNRIRL